MQSYALKPIQMWRMYKAIEAIARHKEQHDPNWTQVVQLAIDSYGPSFKIYTDDDHYVLLDCSLTHLRG